MNHLSNILFAAVFAGAATSAVANDRATCLNDLAKSWDPAARLYKDRKDLGKAGFLVNMEQQFTVGSGDTKVSGTASKDAIMVVNPKTQTLAFYSLFGSNPELGAVKEELVSKHGIITTPSLIIDTAHSAATAAQKKFMAGVQSCQLR